MSHHHQIDWEKAMKFITLCILVSSLTGFPIASAYAQTSDQWIYNDTLVSTDRGIAQWNDKYHGSEITNDEAFHDPEKAVRLMCQYVKRGQLKQWVCFSSGLYKQYSA